MEPGCPASRHRPVATSCARRAAFTHHEKPTRVPAHPPAPGKALRSRESRASRIYAPDPAIGSVTHSESRLCCSGVGCRLERLYRAEGALSMRAPEDVVGFEDVQDSDTARWLRRALDGPGSPIGGSSHASQPLPQHPGRPCGAVGGVLAGIMQ